MMRDSLLVITFRMVPTPVSKKTGATDSWITCATVVIVTSDGMMGSMVISFELRG